MPSRASTSRIGEEHLFAALLASPDSGPLLGRLGDPEQAEAVRAEVRTASAGWLRARSRPWPGWASTWTR